MIRPSQTTETKQFTGRKTIYFARKPKLVIFDFDGVLVDSEVISLSELRAALAEFGVEMTVDAVRDKFLGSAINKIIAFIEEQGHSSDGFAERWYGGLFERFRHELTLIAGVPEILDALQENGIAYCIASGGSYERLGVALNAVGLGERFTDRIFSADLVTHGKPAPDLFLLAAKKMNVPPEACVVIEDSPFGVRAASAAGMRIVGFVGGSHLEGCRDRHSRLLQSFGATQTTDRIEFSMILNDPVSESLADQG
ncbi:MAG: HAD family phosphatase [Pseudomonadota bacterium]